MARKWSKIGSLHWMEVTARVQWIKIGFIPLYQKHSLKVDQNMHFTSIFRQSFTGKVNWTFVKGNLFDQGS